MARLVLLSDLQARVQKRADIAGATVFIPVADITQYINNGWARIYGLLVETGENYYMQQPAFTWNTAANQDTYYTTASILGPTGANVLPTDVYKIKGIDAQTQQGRWINCARYEFESRNDYQATDFSWPLQPMYDAMGSGNNFTIRFIPPPSATAVPMRMWYYNNCPLLVNGTDTIDGGNGWEDYAVDYAAHYCAVKDENWDLVNVLAQSMATMENRIKAAAANRHAGLGVKVRRSPRYKRTGWPWPGGGGWY